MTNTRMLKLLVLNQVLEQRQYLRHSYDTSKMVKDRDDLFYEFLEEYAIDTGVAAN